MYQELRELITRLSVYDLTLVLDPSILAMAKDDSVGLTSAKIAIIAMAVEGKGLLSSKDVRHMLIASFVPEIKIASLAAELKISGKTPYEIIEGLSSRRFLRDEASKKILAALNLGEEYLPEEPRTHLPPSEMVTGDSVFHELLDYQCIVKQRVLSKFRESNLVKCILHLPTGAGKTKTGMHILHDFWTNDHGGSGCIVWLAHTEELLEQAIDTFKTTWSFLGSFDVQVTRIFGAHKTSIDFAKPTIHFIGIPKGISLLKSNHALIRQISDDVKLIVVDEAHKAPAEQTRKLVNELFNSNVASVKRALLGLTATPGRRNGFDDEDERLKRMFNGLKIGIDTRELDELYHYRVPSSSVIHHLQRREILSQIKRSPLEIGWAESGLSDKDAVELRKALGNDSDDGISVSLLRRIGQSKRRNSAILDRLQSLAASGSHIIVFACDIAHAKVLHAGLALRNIASACILGDTSAGDRRKWIDSFRSGRDGLKILINVGVLTTGFDATCINCVFIARPVGSVILYSQMLGRGLRGRKMGGSDECLLVDVVDNLGFGDESWAFKYFDDFWK